MKVGFLRNSVSQVAQAGSGRLADFAKRVRDFGIEGYPPASQRRLRQANVLNAVMVVSYVSFAAFYAALDWPALRLLAFAVLANVPFFFIPPFLHRYSDIAAATYIAAQNTLAFVLFGLIVGSAAGMHIWLLAGGALIVFYGTKRLPTALTVIATMVGVCVFIEFWLPPFSAWAPITPSLAALIRAIAIFGSASLVASFVYLAMYMAEQAETALEAEYSRSEALLRSIMPDKIAERLKRAPQSIIADKYDQVTLVFADVVNFTPKASRIAPEEVVAFLNRIFSSFDVLAEKHGMEKIKTIGDAYMVAGGLTEAQPDQVMTAANLALDMLEAVRDLSHELGEDVSVRIGIHTGPAVAGVLGKRKQSYDVWGDTVNTAAHMESHGSPGRIQVSEAVQRLLDGAYLFESRGLIDIKGKGPMQVYFLVRALRDAQS
jgi:adenylate cyclase